MHWAAELGQEAKCKMLIRLGADSLKRDPNKNTPADVAKLNRHVGLHEILKWASRKQKNGSVVPTGGLIGESEMDRKARILRDDAEFARWKRCKPCLIKETTYDRQKKLPIHMQRRQWSGPLPNKKSGIIPKRFAFCCTEVEARRAGTPKKNIAQQKVRICLQQTI